MAHTTSFKFSVREPAKDFCVPKAKYLETCEDTSFRHIATSTVVVDKTNPAVPRILLLQRAADDEDPNKWEPPGGACDDDDETILHGAARELREEAGLEATTIFGTVGDPVHFGLGDGSTVRRFTFAAQVEAGASVTPAVTLNPKEHQRYVWATKTEIEDGKAGDFQLEFTMREVRKLMLRSFEFF